MARSELTGFTPAAALETERNFRRIIGHEDLWMLTAAWKKVRRLASSR